MKPYDVVVFGATGFTGRLVVDFLVAHYGRELRLGLAGRNRAKLLAVKHELERREPGVRPLGVLLADSADRRALGELVASARAVCTTAGPYARHGEPLLGLCADSGTHYCDLSGELPFLRASIERHHERAQATRARLVHAAGFDSVPSDLGVFMLHEHFRARGKQLASAAAFLTLRGPGLSGGTMSSLLGFFTDLAHNAPLRRLALDPYALVPGRSQRGLGGLDQIGVRYERQVHQWSGPFIMAPVNTRIVRRTNALLGDAYGRDFRYREACVFGQGPKALARALLTSAQFVGLVAAGAFAPGRALIARLGPASGEGPSPAQRAAGSFELTIVGQGDGLRADAVIRGGEPGYSETARMIGEIAVALARDADRLPPRYGVLTPVAALEDRLLSRLRAAGLGAELRAADLTPLEVRAPGPAQTPGPRAE